MILTNNIDIVRIPLNGESLIYLPKNTNFEKLKVGRVFVLADMINSTATQDPYTGKELIAYPLYKNILLTLKNKSGSNILNNVPLDLLLANKNSLKCVINDTIDWDNSFINILAPNVLSNKEIILYVTYEDVYTDKLDIKRVKTVNITPNTRETLLSNYINDKKLGKLVKVEYSNLNPGNQCWFNLYDNNGRCFENINTNLLLTITNQGVAYKQINNPILFNYINIDWERSTIINNSNNEIYTLTFYFS